MTQEKAVPYRQGYSPVNFQRGDTLINAHSADAHPRVGVDLIGALQSVSPLLPKGVQRKRSVRSGGATRHMQQTLDQEPDEP